MYSGTLRVICGSCILAPKCLVFGSCILAFLVSCVRRAFWHPRRLVRVVSCDMLRVQCESCVFCHPMVQRVLCIRTSYVSCVFQHPVARVMCILTCHVCVVCVSCRTARSTTRSSPRCCSPSRSRGGRLITQL